MKVKKGSSSLERLWRLRLRLRELGVRGRSEGEVGVRRTGFVIERGFVGLNDLEMHMRDARYKIQNARSKMIPWFSSLVSGNPLLRRATELLLRAVVVLLNYSRDSSDPRAKEEEGR